MARVIRYVVVYDHNVMEVGDLPKDKLNGFLNDYGKRYEDVFYLDKVRQEVVVKGRVNLEYLNR